MRARAVFVVAVFMAVAGCAKAPANHPPGDPPASTASAITAFPATLEGNLSISNTNDWGYFGDITVGGVEYPVAVPASIFEASGVPDAGGRVRLVVESKQETGNSFQYIAASITKL